MLDGRQGVGAASDPVVDRFEKAGAVFRPMGIECGGLALIQDVVPVLAGWSGSGVCVCVCVCVLERDGTAELAQGVFCRGDRSGFVD